jgi:hypothetical protein
LGTAPPVGDIAAFAVPFKGVELECAIVAWVDIDGNGRVSPAIGEAAVAAPGRFVVVGRQGYLDAVAGLRESVQLGSGPIPLPIAWGFLTAFLAGAKPGQAQELVPATIDPSIDLSHNVGVVAREDGRAQLKRFWFDGRSDVADRIRRSMAVKRAVVLALARERPRIEQALASGAPRFEVPLFASPDPNALEFAPVPDGAAGWALDWDLYVAFHAVSVAGAKCIVSREEPGRVRIEGVLTDTYDFEGRPPAGALSIQAARVQAGFGTLGREGEVFGLRVDLEGGVRNVRWDGTPSLEAGLVSVLRGFVPAGARVRIECTHGPDQGVVIERTADFIDWVEVARDPAGSAGMALLVDPAAVPGSARAWCYRARVL